VSDIPVDLLRRINDLERRLSRTEVIETDSIGGASSGLITVKNTSGATANADDAGYIDSSGEYKTTTTLNLEVAWAVVVIGGANNADIYIARRGRVTVNYTGTDPAAGQFLVTSTVAGSAVVSTYMRPEVFAICTAAGSSGKVSALLLTQRKFRPFISSNNLFAHTTTSSDFVATLNGAPAGAVVTYNAPSSGAETSIQPGATELSKMLIWNTTKSPAQSAKVIAINTGTNQITVSAAADVATWLNTETITMRSQTNTDVISTTTYFADMEITSEIPTLTTALVPFISESDSGAAGQSFRFHPWETGAVAKRQPYSTQASGIAFQTSGVPLPIINNRYTIEYIASGAFVTQTLSLTIRCFAVVVAEP
jgi:hypothetical protein